MLTTISELFSLAPKETRDGINRVCAFIFGFSQLILLIVVMKAIKGGEKATAQVWEGAEGLEWTVPSPAPYHTFETAPVVK